MKNIINLIRVKQWIKNLLIFIPLICSKNISYSNVLNTILGFLAFSCAASFIYIVNDIKDIEKDRLHERKKNRPIASGKVKIKTAFLISLILLVISILLNTYLKNSFFNNTLLLLLTYIIINMAYSHGLKNIAIVDVILLSTGFLLRIFYGASIINVEVSNWLFLTILNASLFLGFGKRRKEMETNKESRKVLKEYTKEFINKFQYLTLTLMLVFYSLWSIEQTNKYLVYTIPLLMVIFMYYCLLLEKEPEGDPTTILFQNKGLFFVCIVYALLMLLLFII